MNEESLFAAAIEKSTTDRQAFLREACGGDERLRQRVEKLLAANEHPPGVLDPGAEANVLLGTPPSESQQRIAEGPGDMIGPYKLKEQIGEGGFGLVFVAEQQQPIRRKIALKIIKPGMDTRDVIARFEAERQALAMMDHPNIAHVLDGGATESGRPYFVMELVRGVAITEYCDQQQLTTRERLELFTLVCHAVQHAHQKGIIHRDLKPSNLLVTLHDSKPVVKVIDFGVAKALNQQLTDQSIYTRFAQMIGTPTYMSPEQAEMSGLDVDTRSDIYSLGVLLYELLTGSTPFDRTRLATAGLDEIRRIIREEEPEKPSTRLSHSKDTLVSVAAQRRIEPAKLTRLLRGELDWIVMKALEKDRTRRYGTANDFARDVQRYLADELVEASPPSTAYRLHKFTRKHRKPLWAAGAFVVLLTAGAIVSSWLAFRATWAEREASDERDRMIAEKQRGDEEAAIAKAVNDFLLKDLLGQADIAQQTARAERDPNIKVRELLDRAAQRIDTKFTDQPRTEAAIRCTLGSAYRTLGEHQEAQRHAARSLALRQQTLGPEHPDTLNSMNELALCYHVAGKSARALPLFEESFRLTKAQRGPDHPDTLTSLSNLAAGYRDAGKTELALTLHKETLERRKAVLRPDHVDTLLSMNNLAVSYQGAGRLDLALPLFEDVLLRMKAKPGADHPDTLQSMHNLAGAYQAAGKLNLAVPLFEEALELRKVKLPPNHPHTLQNMSDLGTAYKDLRKLHLAEPLLQEALERRQEKLGPVHANTLETMNNLAECYRAANKLDLALPLHEKTFRLMKENLEAEHPRILLSMNNLAATYWQSGQLDRSVPLFEEVYRLTKLRHGESHPNTLLTLANLGVNYKSAGRHLEASTRLEEALKGIKELPQLSQAQFEFVPRHLLDAYEKSKQYAKAEPMRRAALAAAQAKDGPQSFAAAEQLLGLGADLLEQKKHADAEPFLRECLTLLQKRQPDASTTFHTQSLLGAALLGQSKLAEAEPFLLQGYEGLKRGEAKLSANDKRYLTEALERLVQLYDASNKPDEAAKMRKELEAKRAETKQ